MANDNDAYDRRLTWQPAPRPAWLARLNELGSLMNFRSIVPLDEDSLTQEAMKNTGLSDFGDDVWIKHFRVLLRAIEDEAKLNFFGRMLTRSDLLVYLEARLNITEWYKRHPEIDQEVIKEPVWVLGFGRSGTTILLEVLSRDPQFRSVRRWEALFPCPPPEAATYETDPRIAKSQALVDVVNAASPTWASMHAQGGDVPVEDIEFTYPAFLSAVWQCSFQIPSYEKYLASQDLAYLLYWHQRTLKLLQWRYKKAHWLLKDPMSMRHLPKLIKTYPDGKFIFAHRDPIVTNDSVVNVEGTIFHWRTDDPWGGNVLSEVMLAEPRAKLWDRVIGWMEDGTIKKGSFTNVLYHEFVQDPFATIQKVYADLGLQGNAEVFERMKNFLDSRPKGGLGRAHDYKKLGADDPVLARERAIYRRYQSYFGVPNER